MTTNTNRRHPIAGLGGAIITYNEAERIRNCLDSLVSLCEEILVLDSYSTDRTGEICAEYPCVRFVQHEFDGYALQKNRALSLARGAWILCLDADEHLTPRAAASVRKFLEEEIAPAIVGAKFVRRSFHMGAFIHHGGWTHSRYRLVRKDRALWRGVSGFPLHELLHPSDGSRWHRGNAAALLGDIIHSSKTDLSNQVDTINVYSSIYASARYNRVRQDRRACRRRRLFLFRMLFKPPLKFFEIYVFKLGFLDGYRGLIIAVSSAFATFLRWAKLYELANTGLREPSNLPRFLRKPGAGF